MPETSTVSVTNDSGQVGPDFFSYYTNEVKELLLQDKDFRCPATKLSGNRFAEVKGNDKIEHGHNGSSSFFTNSVGTGLSDYKKEKLKALLQQTVVALTPEVDEMLDPVVAMCRLQLQVRIKNSISDPKVAASDGDTGQALNKKLRMSSPSSASITALASSISYESCREGDDDLQFLLETDSSLVEETLKKYTDELSTSLGHMEKQLEVLLDTVASTCRIMTHTEKQQLQKLIKKLSPKNLNRIVEIVQRSKPAEVSSHDEVLVDLEQQDNITLWRLYYYVEAVEKARNL